MTSSMAAHVLHCFRIPADIVFFAGDSEYELLKRDLRSYYPLLRNGGFIFGHGINSDRPDVESAVLAICKAKKVVVVPKGTFWVIKKEHEDSRFFSG
uniref:NYN domain-containing protein n=1 Tax=Steinernema glaseri TaxID=37863 RepID=A0A1I8ALH2_9BILA